MRKKFISGGAVLLAAAFIGQTVSAKTLEDILKEKGVITEADYKEVTKVKPIDYKLGKGFTFTSQNEKFQLTIGGRLQARYSFLDRDQEAVPNSQDVSEWRIRRMKVWLTGYAYTKNLTYLLQIDATQSGSGTTTGSTATPASTSQQGSKFIDYAYLNYKLIDEVQLLAGQSKVPFGRQWLNSSGALELVDRSPVSDAFRPGYDIGLMLHGKIANGLVNYNVGGYGGKGQGIVSTNNDNSVAARVTVNPFGDVPYTESDLDNNACPLLSIGANYFYDRLQAIRGGTPAVTTTQANNFNFTQPSSVTNAFGGWMAPNRLTPWFTQNENRFDINQLGFDAAFKWMGVFTQAEYFWGQAVGKVTDKHLNAQGYYVQAGYCILPEKLEAAVRYSYLDPNRDSANDLLTEVIGGIGYYFNKHNLKIQADIANIHQQRSAGVSSDEMQYRMQAQIHF